MNQIIGCQSRDRTVGHYAPTMIATITIPTDKIRDVIGKGGATIRAIFEDTNGFEVDIERRRFR